MQGALVVSGQARTCRDHTVSMGGTTDLAAPQSIVEGLAARERAHVPMLTRTGSLVDIKNPASLQRLIAQRCQDLADLKRLGQ